MFGTRLFDELSFIPYSHLKNIYISLKNGELEQCPDKVFQKRLSSVILIRYFI